MAWVAPPTFASGEILTATKLNQLRDGVMFLNGLGAAPAALTAAVSVSGTYSFWCHRHRHRYLHLRYWGSSANDIKIRYNGVEIFHEGDPLNGDNWITPVDLNAVAGFVAYGLPYELTVELSNGGGQLKLRLLAEMNTVTP